MGLLDISRDTKTINYVHICFKEVEEAKIVSSLRAFWNERKDLCTYNLHNLPYSVDLPKNSPNAHCLGSYGERDKVNQEKFHIFIKPLNGSSFIFWVKGLDLVANLKKKIEKQLGYHANIQHLLFEGTQLQDPTQLQNYCISRSPTISLNPRLGGGAQGSKNLGGSISYNDVVQGKGSKPLDPPQYNPRPYIVEQMKQVLAMEVNLPEANHLFSALQSSTVICRFNGF